MTDVKWIKLSTQMFDDEKIKLIESMPNADTILIIWIKLLTLAGKKNENGFIYLNEKVRYSDEMFATIFNRTLMEVRLALKTFEQFGMIEINEGNLISITNWEKHQNVDGLEKIRLQTRERVAKYRQKQKQKLALECNVTCNDTLTLSNAPEEEKNKNKNKINIYSNEFEQFWNIYPRKVDKKKALAAFKKAMKRHPLEKILFGTEKYMIQTQNTDKQYIKHPATFLNNDSFIDGYEEIETVVQGNTKLKDWIEDEED